MADAELLAVSEAVREIRDKHGLTIRPQDLTNLLYKRELNDEIYPLVGGRRLIPRNRLAEFARLLAERLQGRSAAEEASRD